MASVTRKDGATFVVPAYRDTIKKRTGALLKKEILNIATNYAAFVHLEIRGPKEVEASFSPTAGYLLAETVWDFFDKPSDLIFCEELPETNEVILIVIRASCVYLDLVISLDGFFDELAALSTLEGSFEVRTFGDLPLSAEPQEGKFSFSEEQVLHFTQLTESVFQKLPCLNKYALRDVTVELSAHRIGGLPLARIVIGILIAAFLFLIWDHFTTPVTQATVVRRIDSFQNYRVELMRPGPADYLKLGFFNLRKVLSAPGWSPTKVAISRTGIMTIEIRSKGQSLQRLEAWANKKQFKLDFLTKGSVQLTKSLPIQGRHKPDDIFQHTMLTTHFIDRMNMLMVYKDSVTVGTIKKVGKITYVPVIVKFGPMSMEVFEHFIELVRGKYQTFDSAQWTYQDGLLSGQLALTLLGE